MADNVSELFGDHPGRPSHPDFWRISEIVLSNDGPMEEARDNEEKERAWRARTNLVVDVDSVTYMAMQRARFAVGERDLPLLGRVTTVWIDAFVTGAGYERAGGHREPATDVAEQFAQVMAGSKVLGDKGQRELVVLMREMDALRAAICSAPMGLPDIREAYERAQASVDKLTGRQSE